MFRDHVTVFARGHVMPMPLVDMHECSQRRPSSPPSTRGRLKLAASSFGVAVVCTALVLQRERVAVELEESFYAPKPWHPTFRTNPTPLHTLPNVNGSPQQQGQQDFYPTAMQNAYLYAQHVAQSRTGSLLRWRNYVTQGRSKLSPHEVADQASGLAAVAKEEYSQAVGQLKALKHMARLRQKQLQRREGREVGKDVNREATALWRGQELAHVTQLEQSHHFNRAAKVLELLAKGEKGKEEGKEETGKPTAATAAAQKSWAIVCGKGACGPQEERAALAKIESRMGADEKHIDALSLQMDTLRTSTHNMLKARGLA